MPTLASLTSPVNQELYNYHFNQRAAELALYHSAISASSIHQSLLAFRSHHQRCSSRRRYALASEMKQESQRADWLKRKYIDSVRQQQPSQQPTTMASSSSGRAPGGSVTVTTSVAGERKVNSDTCDHQKHQCDVKPMAATGTSASPSGPTLPTRLLAQNVDSPSKTLVGGRDQPAASVGLVRVKREPDSEQCAHTPSTPALCTESHEATSNEPHPLLPEQTREPEPRRRDSIKAEHFKWTNVPSISTTLDQDNRDDLKLTAYDVIAGVISTPPIKPLEPETDSSSYKVGGARTSQNSPSICSSSQHINSGAANSPASKTRKEQQELVHELDHFSKIMDEVSQQQAAIEMAAANNNGGSYAIQKTDHKQHQQKQNYHSNSQATATKETATSFYRTYGSSQVAGHEGVVPPVQSQGISVDTKSPLQQSRCSIPRRLTLLNEVPLSPSGQQPPVALTPTTPLEHLLPAPSPTIHKASAAQSTTPVSQAPHLATPHHHVAHPASPHHLPALPSTSRHHTALPSATHYHMAPPSTPHQHSLHHHSVGPATPRQNSVGPNTPHQNSVGLGTPHQSSVSLGTPHQNSVGLGTPHQNSVGLGTSHQSMGPGTSHRHSVGPGTPHHYSVGPNTPHHHSVGPGTPHHHSIGLGTPHHHSVGPGTPHHHSVGPGTPHHHSVGPGTPHHHSVGPHHALHGTPQLLGSASHHINNSHSSSASLPHPTTPYMCPPYPATPQYSFESEPARYSISMPTETWTAPPNQMVTSLSTPLPPDQVSTPTSSQGSLRESIMARVSSRVETLAGHKRPLHLDLTGAPPTKMKNTGGELPPTGQCPPVGPSSSGYSTIQHSPYHTPSAHQPL